MTWHRQFSRRQLMYLGSLLLLITMLDLSIWLVLHRHQPTAETEVVKRLPSSQPRTVAPAPTASPVPPPTPNPPPPNQFLFGVGSELDSALNHRITKEAPIKLLTSWYNGPNDLAFMNGWRTTLVPEAYASGYAQHLIIYSNDSEQNLDTPYGPACGRPYPLSQQFLTDVQQLAQNFSGGKLYVSMFTEFQTYPCEDNTWASAENYYKALKDQYLAAMNTFHQFAPGSQVSLSWGGWQTKWDDVSRGGGRSLFGHFADVMNASDFQSFQAMATTGNLAIITDMTKALHPYSGGVMAAHYKPDDGSQNTFEADMRDIFTPSNIAALQQNELFAFSFMDTDNMDTSEAVYQSIRHIVHTYAR